MWFNGVFTVFWCSLLVLKVCYVLMITMNTDIYSMKCTKILHLLYEQLVKLKEPRSHKYWKYYI